MQTAIFTSVTKTLYFPSEKSKLFAWIHWGCTGLLIASFATCFYGYITEGNQFVLLFLAGFCLLIAVLLGWAWVNTGYTISDDLIIYRSGIMHGTITISNIKSITMNDTLMSGLRPALAQKGLIIQYSDWKEIYISPVKKKVFVELLREINPQIKVNEVMINFNKY